MTEKQNRQYEMQKTIVGVMEKHITKWQSVKELKKKYDRFIRSIKKIEDYDLILKSDLSPLKRKRSNAKQALIDQVFPVTSVLSVYASDLSDKELANLVNVKYGGLEKKKNEGLIKYCFEILKIARQLMEKKDEQVKKTKAHKIADYGLTARHLDALQGCLDQFIRDVHSYKETTTLRKKSRKKLERRIKDNERLMTKKLDKMMHLHRDNQKIFYDAYIKARILGIEKKSENAAKKQTTHSASPFPEKQATTAKIIASPKPATKRKPPGSETA